MPATRRAAVVIGALAAMTILPATAADAHVTVHPITVAQGDHDGTLTFRVPDESDTLTTTQVQVFFPTDHPIATVLAQPLPGWTDQVTTSKLATPIHTDDGDITDAVTKVTWTGGHLTPGHYQDFTVAYGLLPSTTNQLVFKTLQTYSDGSVVRWIDQSTAAVPNPDHPAPVLKLTNDVTKTATTVTTAAAPASGSGNGMAVGLALAALIVALGALALLARSALKARHGASSGD
jgi:uncharacterized protein YcnI